MRTYVHDYACFDGLAIFSKVKDTILVGEKRHVTYVWMAGGDTVTLICMTVCVLIDWIVLF